MNTKKVLIPLAVVGGLSLTYYLETNYHIKDKLNVMFAKQNDVVEEFIDDSQTLEQALVNNEPFVTQSFELPNIIPSNYSLSAKPFADEEYRNGNYSDAKKWWELVCKHIDKLHAQESGNTQATTEEEIELWNKRLDATIDDIHSDDPNLSKDWIRGKILDACFNNTGNQIVVNTSSSNGLLTEEELNEAYCANAKLFKIPGIGCDL